MGQVHSSDPPGRFLKQDTSTKLWVEITNEKAKKKVGQAFRDIISPDERSRIVIDDIAADATTTESDNDEIATYIIDYLNQETAESTQHLDRTTMPPSRRTAFSQDHQWRSEKTYCRRCGDADPGRQPSAQAASADGKNDEKDVERGHEKHAARHARRNAPARDGVTAGKKGRQSPFCFYSSKTYKG